MKRRFILALALLAFLLTACTEQESNELREKVKRYLRMIHPVAPEQISE